MSFAGDRLSLRDAWGRAGYDAYGPLSRGLFHGSYRENRSKFPFRSLRRLMNATFWPREPTPAEVKAFRREMGEDPMTLAFEEAHFGEKAFRQTGGLRFRRRYPDGIPGSDVVGGRESGSYAVNGLCHDGVNWYLTSVEDLGDHLRSYVSRYSGAGLPGELRTAAEVLKTPDAVSEHAGAGVFYAGRVFVPVEGNTHPDAPDSDQAQIWVVNPNSLTVEQRVLVEAGWKKAPWCAINSDRQLLYVSAYDPGLMGQIRIYSLRRDGSTYRSTYAGTLTLVTELGAAFPAQEVQAAIVTPNFHLLLLCDTPVGTAVSGLHLFDLVTGVRRWHQRVEFSELYGPFAKYDEMEAMCIWDRGGDAILWLAAVTKGLMEDSLGVFQYDTWNPLDRPKL